MLALKGLEYGEIQDPGVALTTLGVTDYEGVDMTYLRPFTPSSLYSHKENYLRYLDSREWRERKRAYWLSNRPNYCWACNLPWEFGAKGFNFHHISYKNLYNEPLEDLVLLCFEHHKAIEQEWPEAKRNGLSLELWTYMFICQHRLNNNLPIKPLMRFFKGLIG